MTSAPRVSALIAAFNAEDFVQEAAESVLAQTMTDLELIVLDDGSTDNTLEILERVAATDPRMRVMSRENKGLSQSRCDLIDAALAPYFAIMDADDICMPNRFELQLARLEADPELVAVSGQCLFIDPEGWPIRTNDLPIDHNTIDTRHMEMPPICSMAQPAVMVRRTAMEQIGGYHHDYPYAEDVDMYLRLAEIGKLANLEDVVLKYRLHPKSVGHAFRKVQLESAIRAGHHARARRGLPPYDDPIDTAAFVVEEAGGGSLQRWGWWALAGGHPASSRRFARKALMQNPLKKENWRLAVCAMRDSFRAGAAPD